MQCSVARAIFTTVLLLHHCLPLPRLLSFPTLLKGNNFASHLSEVRFSWQHTETLWCSTAKAYWQQQASVIVSSPSALHKVLLPSCHVMSCSKPELCSDDPGPVFAVYVVGKMYEMQFRGIYKRMHQLSESRPASFPAVFPPASLSCFSLTSLCESISPFSGLCCMEYFPCVQLVLWLSSVQFAT